MRTSLRSLGLALIAAVVVVSSAMASTPVTVSYIGCVFANGGFATVAPDSDVSVRFGFVASTSSKLKSIISASTVYVAVDDQAAVVAGSFSAPAKQGDVWVTFWTYDTGRVLASGQSTKVYVNWYLSRKVWDGTRDDNGKPAKYGPGFQLPNDVTCTVSAS